MPKLFVAPSEPLSLKPYSVTSTTVTLQWKPPRYTNGVITRYSIHYNGIDIDRFGDATSDKMTDVIEGLSPDTEYVLEMEAYTRVGAGLPVSLVVKTGKLLNIVMN